MALTKTEMVRRALSQLGQSYTPSNVDNDDSQKASDYRMAYDMALEEAISLYAPWHFLIKETQLSELTTYDVPEPYEVAYQLPKNTSQIITTYPLTDYDIREDVLLTWNRPLNIKYTIKPLPEDMPMYFTSFFVYLIADKLGPSIAKNEQLYAQAKKMKDVYLANAQAKDAQQQTQVGILSSPLIQARFSGTPSV